MGFVAAGRPELGAGGFGRAHLGSPDDRLETSAVCARGRVGGGERRGRRRSALYDPERTLATASSDPRREGRGGGAALPSEPRLGGRRSEDRRRTDRLSEERRSEGQSDEERRSDKDPDATLDEVREAVSTLEDTERTARRVLGGAHPTTKGIQDALQDARAALRARDGGVSAIREAVEKMTPGDA